MYLYTFVHTIYKCMCIYFQKPYACQVTGCGKRYTDPSSLRKHVKNHSEPTTPLSNLPLTPENKPCNSTNISRHDATSMTSKQQQQQQMQTTPVTFAGESNYRTYKTSECYADEDADLFQTNLCQVDRFSVNLESNQEYVPIESVKRFLIDDVSNSHVDGTGKPGISYSNNCLLLEGQERICQCNACALCKVLDC